MKTDDATQNIGTFSKLVLTCSCCEGFALTKSSKSKAVLRPYLGEVLQMFSLKEAQFKVLFKANHAHALMVYLSSAAANSSITSMLQVDRGGIHEDSMGNEVVKYSVGTAPASTPSGHRPTPRETAARSKMHRLSAGRGVDKRRGVRMRESAKVGGGCIVKGRACFVISNFSGLKLY